MWLWINANQAQCLRHYDAAEDKGHPILRPGGIPSWPTYWACKRKGLIEVTPNRAHVLTALGRAALQAWPDPVELRPGMTQSQGENA